MQRLAPAPDLGVPLEAVELLDVLDRVARDRGAQGLARDAVEVDEHLAAQEVVDLLLARRVLAHEARERGALVGRVVVDVHAREAPAPLDDVVDELLEGALLGLAVVGPEGVVARLAVLVERDPAGEVLEAARRLEPGVAFEVEPDVARGRLRHEREAAVFLQREVVDLVLAGAALVELERGLVAEPLEGRRPHARDAGLLGGLGEELERRDARLLEPLDLEARDARDEDEVVVLLPLRLAEVEEVAEAAVLDRVRVGVAAVLDRVEEAPLEAPVVGGVVAGSEGLALAEAVDDVHELGRAALDARELLGVEGELEDVRGPRAARELRVDDLVGAVRVALDEVGDPTPAVVLEAGLVDDVGCAVADRRLGLGRGLGLDDALALGAEPSR